MKKSTIKTPYELSVVIERDSKTTFFAYVPALQGCYTSGSTFDEALANIRDAAILYIEDLKQDKIKVPRRSQMSILSLEVIV
jgi:predicted RNase H-like HicB family nuclease